MSTPAQRIEVFQDTQDWINNDPDLSASISPTLLPTCYNVWVGNKKGGKRK